ncbi:DUF1707 domain-containing protein [Glycomyces sp. TRM65418]|uniref:DUF1707 domain-containing protein n=1 Tax=Glycomyces sp. TRM65418 TaxID=2867006 RepID=UPI001CE63BA5|nr:DUF1707 domain-containing protein [Glycomyces sp. TRM65418]MCC3762298.1 DUF1707 domain-containing protein [Glycomyces sp. TRM65418]QZD56352.1 DUF1707 domain-containing protein [Glycomyces sp. TRM65418]
MDAYAAKASRADKRIALDRLARARRKGMIDTREYRLRRRLAEQAQSLAELQSLLQDVPDDQHSRDHWRYGRWRGPVKEGRELEIQRFVGVMFLSLALLVVVACVYAVIALYEQWR